MTSQRQTKITKSYVQLAASIRENGGVECEQVPEIFYPEDSPFPSEGRMMRELAQTICGRCPIKNQCADYAINSDEPFGIWGGLTPQDREKLKRK